MAIKRDLTVKEARALVRPLEQTLQVFVNLHRLREHLKPDAMSYQEQIEGLQQRITVMIWNIRDEMRALREIIDGEEQSKESDNAHAKTRSSVEEDTPGHGGDL